MMSVKKKFSQKKNFPPYHSVSRPADALWLYRSDRLLRATAAGAAVVTYPFRGMDLMLPRGSVRSVTLPPSPPSPSSPLHSGVEGAEEGGAGGEEGGEEGDAGAAEVVRVVRQLLAHDVARWRLRRAAQVCLPPLSLSLSLSLSVSRRTRALSLSPALPLSSSRALSLSEREREREKERERERVE